MPDDFDVPMPTRSLLPVKVAKTEPIYAQGVAALGLTNDQMAYLSFYCGWELWRDKDARFLLRNYKVVSAGYLEAWRATPDSSFLGDGTDTLLNDIVKEAKFVPAGRELGEDDEIVVHGEVIGGTRIVPNDVIIDFIDDKPYATGGVVSASHWGLFGENTYDCVIPVDLAQSIAKAAGGFVNGNEVHYTINMEEPSPLLDADMLKRIQDVARRSAEAVRLDGRDPGRVNLDESSYASLMSHGGAPVKELVYVEMDDITRAEALVSHDEDCGIFVVGEHCDCEKRLKPEDRVGVHVEGRGPRRAEPPVAREGARPGDVGGAMKLDAGKAPLYNGFINYFPHAMIAVAWVSEYGFRKYGEWGGWRKVFDGIFRYFDGNARHNVLSAIETYDDGDSGLAHAAQDAWNAMAKLELMLTAGKVDIRRGNDVVDGKPVLGTARKMS